MFPGIEMPLETSEFLRKEVPTSEDQEKGDETKEERRQNSERING
jgi:hypothetical protein